MDKYPAGVNPYGCFDMAGNVWEWTESWSDNEEKYRILRGGSWISDAGDCRCTFRGINSSVDRDFVGGFRCARTLKL